MKAEQERRPAQSHRCSHKRLAASSILTGHRGGKTRGCSKKKSQRSRAFLLGPGNAATYANERTVPSQLAGSICGMQSKRPDTGEQESSNFPDSRSPRDRAQACACVSAFERARDTRGAITRGGIVKAGLPAYQEVDRPALIAEQGLQASTRRTEDCNIIRLIAKLTLRRR